MKLSYRSGIVLVTLLAVVAVALVALSRPPPTVPSTATPEALLGKTEAEVRRTWGEPLGSTANLDTHESLWRYEKPVVVEVHFTNGVADYVRSMPPR